MTEQYLHFLWRKKRLPVVGLELTDGTSIDILHFGFYNSNQAGPDFSMGIILIEQTELIGPIEMHVKSSDWYRHKHHLDSNYDNVILHVVFEHDQSVVQKGRLIPTLELKSLIDPLHERNYYTGSYRNQNLICSGQLRRRKHEFEIMKERALFERMEDKLTSLQETEGAIRNKILLRSMARAFGTTVNKAPFDELCNRLPISVLQNMDFNKSFTFVCNQAGLTQDSFNGSMVWQNTGLRPQNRPIIRIRQFAHFVAHFFSSQSGVNWNRKNIDEIREFLFNNRRVQGCPDLSDLFIEHLLINVFIPLLMLNANEPDIGTLRCATIEELRKMRPEANRITRQWQKEGVNVKTAYDSQALLALNAYYCSRKKCLSCEVGKSELKHAHDTENCFLF